MRIIEDIILVQKHTIKKAGKGFIKNWPIIFTGLIYMILNLLAIIVINSLFRGILSILSGIFIAIVSSSLISSYLYLLFNIISNNRITFQNLKDGFTQYLWKLYGIFFILWLVSYILSAVSRLLGGQLYLFIDIFTIGVFVLLNALPETIYQKYYSSYDSIKYAFEFIKENWINWFIPNIVFFTILYILTGKTFNNLFTIYVYVPLKITLTGIIRYIIIQSIFSFMMIYRGYLFQLLSTSTRRKRMFLRNLYE